MNMPQIIVLEPDEWDRFVEIMTTPCEPSPAMVAAAKRHREWTMKPRVEAEDFTSDITSRETFLNQFPHP